MRATIPPELERAIRRIARRLKVSQAKVIECALQRGMDGLEEAIAEALCNEAFEPLRVCAKKHKGKSLGEVARRGRKRG